jgi:hypothetical protein
MVKIPNSSSSLLKNACCASSVVIGPPVVDGGGVNVCCTGKITKHRHFDPPPPPTQHNQRSFTHELKPEERREETKAGREGHPVRRVVRAEPRVPEHVGPHEPLQRKTNPTHITPRPTHVPIPT